MPDRRLAAILAADIVGYSALMAEDEAGTLEALRRLRRELFHPAVAGHRGKVVKDMGDGWLAEFASAADAVNCAVQVQNGLIGNATIEVRIGIHIGDITHEDEDVYGDGVNVAARLEALAEAGAVAISDAVYGALDGTLQPSFDDTGEQVLKNIPRSVRVWVRTATPTPAMPTAAQVANPQRASFPVVIAVRPINTSDPRPQVRELAAALTSDLFTYLDTGLWLNAIVAEHAPAGTFVLSCNLRALGDRLRLDANVLGKDGALLWSKRIDGGLEDCFDWQDRTGMDLAGGAISAIHDAEIGRIHAQSEGDRTAADWVQLDLMTAMGRLESPETTLPRIERAIALDPDWGLPYALHATRAQLAVLAGHEDPDDGKEPIDWWIEKARKHSDGDLVTELIAAYAEHRQRPTLAQLKIKIDAVLRRFPYHEAALTYGGVAYAHSGDANAAEECARKLLVSTASVPGSEAANRLLGAALIQLSRDEEAYEAMQRALEITPDSILNLRFFASAAALAGHLEEARAAVRRLEELSASTSIASIDRVTPFADTPGTRRYYEGLRLAGLPEGEA